jgi:hypothetical protein
VEDKVSAAEAAAVAQSGFAVQDPRERARLDHNKVYLPIQER